MISVQYHRLLRDITGDVEAIELWYSHLLLLKVIASSYLKDQKLSFTRLVQ